MEIIFIASSRIPTERAMGTAIMKQCEAFARQGITVTLIVPKRRHTVFEDPFTYHRVEQNFTIREVWCLELLLKNRFAYYIRQVTFFGAVTLALFGMPEEAIIYSREPELIAFIPTRKMKCIELHHFFGLRRCGGTILKQFSGIIAITHALKEDIISRYAYPKERVHVAPSGVDLKEFENPESKETARARLGLPSNAKIALYVGSLETWKGVETFLVASKALTEKGVLCVVIGGTKAQVTTLTLKYPDVRFLGQRPQSELPDNQQVADVLVVPNTAREEISARHTSPLKVFAHMASGIPIIASAISSIKEILDDTNATLVLPDDSKTLIAGIRIALTDKTGSVSRTEKARKDVVQYDWNHRAEKVLSFIRIPDTREL